MQSVVADDDSDLNMSVSDNEFWNIIRLKFMDEPRRVDLLDEENDDDVDDDDELQPIFKAARISEESDFVTSGWEAASTDSLIAESIRIFFREGGRGTAKDIDHLLDPTDFLTLPCTKIGYQRKRAAHASYVLTCRGFIIVHVVMTPILQFRIHIP